MIYVFGNSHANTFTRSSPGAIGVWNSDEKFSSFSLGPVIAYNFRDHYYPRVLQILNSLKIDENDYIVLAVGEVDHRWHLPKKAAMNRLSIEDVTDECVDRFFECMLDLKEKKYNVIAWGSHPSTTAEHNENPESPIFGDCLTRNLIGKRWNDRLQRLCSQNDIPFVSIFDELIQEDGLTKMEYYMDYCHLDHDKIRDMLENRFEKYFQQQ